MNKDVKNVAAYLATQKAKEMDLDREFSHGVGAGKSFIQEGVGSPNVSLTIENSFDTDKVIVFGKGGGIFVGGDDAFLKMVGADAILTDGIILEDHDSGSTVTCSSNDPGRTLEMFGSYAALNPLRFVSVSLDSTNVKTGAPDTTNFSSQLKTAWLSPFQKPVENFLPLRKFQDNKSTATQFADIDFIKEGFLVMLSMEHYFIVTVKKQTRLTMTLSVGAQLSLAQKAYRAFGKADETLRPFKG